MYSFLPKICTPSHIQAQSVNQKVLWKLRESCQSHKISYCRPRELNIKESPPPISDSIGGHLPTFYRFDCIFQNSIQNNFPAHFCKHPSNSGFHFNRVSAITNFYSSAPLLKTDTRHPPPEDVSHCFAGPISFFHPACHSAVFSNFIVH